jgi:putative membrane protein insertion efficiency factor
MIGKTVKFIVGLPAKSAVCLIGAYQLLLSPDHSWLKGHFPHGYCRFYPSCSEYSKQSIIRFGLVKGFWLSAKRLLHCHPWAEPQIDLVPHS